MGFSQALRQIAEEGCLVKQLVARPVTGDVTRQNRKRMKDAIRFNTEGNEIADEYANTVADLHKANRAA